MIQAVDNLVALVFWIFVFCWICNFLAATFKRRR